MYIHPHQYQQQQLGQASPFTTPDEEAAKAQTMMLQFPPGMFWRDVGIAVIASVLSGVALYLVMKHVK